ncbi:MAG: hypothetical protein WD904_08755 [Dehalococcoidia bacterium]
MSGRGPIGGIQDYLGIGELSFELDDRDRRSFRVACALPALAILANAASFTLDVFRGYGYDSNEIWRRLDAFSGVVQSPLTYVGLAGLVVFGVGRVSHAQGSWAFAIAILLILAGFAAGFYSSMMFLFAVDADLYETYHVSHALTCAWQFGTLAVGFAFLAFRGLSSDQADWDQDEEAAA